MEHPDYVLRAEEAVLVPKKDTEILVKLKPAVWIVIGIIIILSFIFGDNIYKELSWTARGLLVALAMGIFFVNSDERVPSPFEIWFYGDYLVIYREKHYYSRKVTRKEYDKFYYKDIKQCQFRTVTQRINFYGIVEGIWYNYRKDGTLPLEPTYHKTTDSIRYFYTMYAKNIDFVREIEAHSPVRVEIQNN